MTEKVPYVIDRGCDFDAIDGENFSNPCSPRLTDPRFTGVLINLPEVVDLDRGDFRVPLACTFAHRLSDGRSSNAPIENAIIFVAVDLRSHEVYSGRVLDMENPLPPPPAEGGGAAGPASGEAGDFEVLDEIVGGYVNLDLVKTLRLPKTATEYSVYATFEKHKSNVLQLRVTGAGG